MAGELEKALSDKIGEGTNNDELMCAMCNLLILLLERYKGEGTSEEDELMKGMKDRIMNKYPKYSSLANTLIPSPS